MSNNYGTELAREIYEHSPSYREPAERERTTPKQLEAARKLLGKEIEDAACEHVALGAAWLDHVSVTDWWVNPWTREDVDPADIWGIVFHKQGRDLRRFLGRDWLEAHGFSVPTTACARINDAAAIVVEWAWVNEIEERSRNGRLFPKLGSN